MASSWELIGAFLCGGGTGLDLPIGSSQSAESLRTGGGKNLEGQSQDKVGGA